MNRKAEIHESEWRALLEESYPKPPANGKTTRQLAAIWGCSVDAVKWRIARKLRDRVDLVRVGKVCYYVPRITQKA